MVGHQKIAQSELDPAVNRQETNLPLHDAQKILLQMVSYHKDHETGD